LAPSHPAARYTDAIALRRQAHRDAHGGAL
jgi:hypothetical protein